MSGYQSGRSGEDLGTELGVSGSAVIQALRRAGVTIRHQPLNEAQCAEAIRLHQQGWSLARVGQQLGRDGALIHLVLKRAGVPRRDTHGRERL